MPVIIAIFNNAAPVTVSGCLAAFLFKQTVVNPTSKAVKDAENVTAGLVVSEPCLSMAILVIASHKTARILLSNDSTHQVPAAPKHDLAEPNLVPLAGNRVSDFSAAFSPSSNPIATESSSTSTSTNSTAPCTPLLPSSPLQRLKRLSIGSDTTLVDHDDDFFGASDLRDEDGNCSGNLPPGTKVLPVDDTDGPSPDLSLDALTEMTTLSLGSTPSQIATPRLKPPDTKRHQSFRPGRHKHEYRVSRLVAARDSIERTHAKQLEHTTMIIQLEQLHNELLVNQAALVDGYAAAMAQLGLTSLLSPGPPLSHQKTETRASFFKTDTFTDNTTPEVSYDQISKTRNCFPRRPLRLELHCPRD